MSALRTFLSQFIVQSLLCYSGIFTSSTHADIIIAIENVTTSVTNPTGTAITADISVSWNVGGGSVNVDYASMEFQISTPSGATSLLSFQTTQLDAQLLEPSDLFFDRSQRAIWQRLKLNCTGQKAPYCE
jgi:hypothetical protein